MLTNQNVLTSQLVNNFLWLYEAINCNINLIKFTQNYKIDLSTFFEHLLNIC